MQIRITKPVLEVGPVQWTRGQIAVVPEAFGQELIDRKEAVLVPVAEHATLPGRHTAVVPRPVAKPKPPSKGRR